MNKFILFTLLVSGSALADIDCRSGVDHKSPKCFTLVQHNSPHGNYGDHRGNREWHPNYGWVVPSIIGGIITYEIIKNQPPPPVIVQQPVYVERPPVQQCSDWVEVVGPDGKIYQQRRCYN